MQLTEKPKTEKVKRLKEKVKNPFQVFNDFEKILSRDTLLKNHKIEIGKTTVSDYIKNYSPVIDINPDYQRCTKEFVINGENRWSYNQKKEYIISLIRGLAPTLFIMVDYNSCKNNLTNDEKMENELYFQNLIGNGYKYGLLDGGHRNNVLNLLLNPELVNENGKLINVFEKLLNDIASEFLIQVSQIKDLLLNSEIFYIIYNNLNRKEIHYLFRNANSGVHLSTNEINTSILSPMNDYINELKRNPIIENLFNYVEIKEKIKSFYLIQLCYFYEMNKDVKSYTGKDYEKFLENEKPSEEMIQRQKWIFENMEKLYKLSFNDPTNIKPRPFSSTRFISLYMILSIIYDNGKNVNSKKYLPFIKIFNGILLKYSNDRKTIQSNNKRDSWHDRFRSNKGYISEKWKLFLNIYIDKKKTYNFKTESPDSSSIQDYLINS